MSRFMSRFVLFSNCKKSNIANPTVFAGGANSRRWGRAGPSRRRLAHTAPGPAGDIFKITGPSPTRSERFQSTRCRPGPASEFPISLVVCPAWPVRFSEYFRFFFVVCLLLEVSRQQRARSPGPAASLGSRSLSTIGITKQGLPCPYTGLRIPLVRVVYVVP